MSLNQSTIAVAVKVNPNDNKSPPLARPCMYKTADTVKVNKAKLVKIGQGEGSTK